MLRNLNNIIEIQNVILVVFKWYLIIIFLIKNSKFYGISLAVLFFMYKFISWINKLCKLENSFSDLKHNFDIYIYVYIAISY